MKIDAARGWIIWGSLTITASQCLFLGVSPAFGFPLEFPKNLDILEMVGPVFLGYLGAAAAFIFKDPPPDVQVNEKFLGPLVIGPLSIYGMYIIGVLAAFGYSNRIHAPSGVGMSAEVLSRSLAIGLGILAATTSFISSHVFVVQKSK